MIKRILEILLIYLPATFLVLSISLVFLYKWIPVRWTPLMLIRTVENHGNKGYRNIQNWVEITDVAPSLIEAVRISEDSRFYSHSGFDVREIQRMRYDHMAKGMAIRGCSTISQQVAKNCFTFCSRTLSRKLSEAYYTVLVELIWGKERILEVYLNVAETGRVLFGVEAACQRYFSCPASDLAVSDAAALACVLPKPLTRTPEMVMSVHSDKHLKLSKEVGKTMNKLTTY